MAKRGGARPGGGRPKGSVLPKTLEIQEARKQMQAYILKRLEPLLQAQASLARGVQYVYEIVTLKDDKGKTIRREHVQLKDPDKIKHALDVLEGFSDAEDSEYYYLTSEKPDVRAIDSMLDRTFGKATQSLELDNPQQNEELKKINAKLKEMFSNAKSKKPRITAG